MAVANHQASAQMLGYLYQVRCALDILLSDANEQLSICIEKFDDIAFSNDGVSPSALIQTNVGCAHNPNYDKASGAQPSG